jgi:16S rRNA (guanine527-N7)-methyltransferase
MLEEGARKLGVEFNAEQIELFLIYLVELKKWNKKINLTSIVEDEKIVSSHFLDSMSCLVSKRISPASKMVDLGAGAGFPGIPLKIACPPLCLTLIDSSKKKADFLKFLVKKLKLKNVEVVCKRAEEFAKASSNREDYDIVVARAVSFLPVLIEYSLPLLKIGGALIAQKGRKDEEELERGRKAASILGGEIEKILKVDVPFLDEERHLVIVGKASATPLKFPRRTGVPQKRSLGKD